jgi:phosphatidylserine decarboxylase
MDRDGLLFAGVPLVMAIAFAYFQLWIPAGVFIFLASFMLFFFRDPLRVTPEDDSLITSSADGKVTRVEERPDGKFVSVFLSPFDVHINRAPITGEVKEVKLFKGLKRPATSDSASETNERNAVTLEGERMTVVVTQIVGILARRIVCRTNIGDNLRAGQKFGLIRFGSRTDLLMPSNVEVLVKPGDRVKGGETVIAKLPVK